MFICCHVQRADEKNPSKWYYADTKSFFSSLAKATLKLKFLIVKFRRKKKKDFWLDFFLFCIICWQIFCVLGCISSHCYLIFTHVGIHNYKLFSTIKIVSILYKFTFHSKSNSNKTIWIVRASSRWPDFYICSYILWPWWCLPAYFDGITLVCAVKKLFRSICTMTLKMMLSDFTVPSVRQDLSFNNMTYLGNLH